MYAVFCRGQGVCMEGNSRPFKRRYLNGLRHVIYDTSVISSCFDGKADYADIVTSDQDKTLSAEELTAISMTAR